MKKFSSPPAFNFRKTWDAQCLFWFLYLRLWYFVLQVNGKPVNFPFKSKGLSVQLVGTYISVKTSFGLEMRYQSPYNVYINLDSSFNGKVTGNAFADVYNVKALS